MTLPCPPYATHVLRSESAEDVGATCLKYGAASITVSYRSAPMPYAMPANWTQRPLVRRMDGNRVSFEDGGADAEFDAILLCTGYLHHFPFLPDDLRLRTRNRPYPPGLYRGVAWQDNPRLLYLGMSLNHFTFVHFDLSAWWARGIVLGRIVLPTRAEMSSDTAAWVAREEGLEGDAQRIRFNADHCLALAAETTGYPYLDFDALVATFLAFMAAKSSDFMGFRNLAHTSAVTGSVATVPRIPWMDEMDHSVAAFVENSECPRTE
jgi:trimethylamine monooxygenase